MEWLTSLDWFALSCWFGAIVLIVLGFAGTIVPAIPGLPMIAAGDSGTADDCRRRVADWLG